ncbi:MAG: prepilin peptidase [Planctomycetota bacterium]
MLIFSSPAFWVPALILVGVAVHDALTGKISDLFSLALVAWAIAARAFGWWEPDWGFLVLGLVAGLAIGLVAFRLGALGGGDGKVLAGLGACFGPVKLLLFLPWIALVGGLLAVLALRKGSRDVVLGPAFLVGYVLALTF